ncbi:MAG: hypothetical protein K5931_01010 [Lachnospiraceae bacterium]|nr:hypothetical protein [Lachnospiraceae bacterium]
MRKRTGIMKGHWRRILGGSMILILLLLPIRIKGESLSDSPGERSLKGHAEDSLTGDQKKILSPKISHGGRELILIEDKGIYYSRKEVIFSFEGDENMDSIEYLISDKADEGGDYRLLSKGTLRLDQSVLMERDLADNRSFKPVFVSFKKPVGPGDSEPYIYSPVYGIVFDQKAPRIREYGDRAGPEHLLEISDRESGIRSISVQNEGEELIRYRYYGDEPLSERISIPKSFDSFLIRVTDKAGNIEEREIKRG